MKKLYYRFRLWLLIEAGEHLALAVLVLLGATLLGGAVFIAHMVADGILRRVCSGHY